MNVFDLLEQKDFEQLNEIERGLVLSEMSEAEYTEQRDIIVSASFLFSSNSKISELKAPAVSNVIAVLPKRRNNLLARVVSYKMPIWQAAAILVCILSFNYLINDNKKEKKLYVTNYVSRVVEQKQNVDTVYKTIYKEAPNKTNNSRVQQAESRVELHEAIEQNKIAMLNDFNKELESINSSFGVSIQRDTLAKKILGVIL